MNIHFGNQSQFELFPGTTGEPIENTAPRFIFSRVVLTFENLVVAFVFILVSLIIAYSVGVERGRRYVPIARPAMPAASGTPAVPSKTVLAQIQVTPIPVPSRAISNNSAVMVTQRPAPTLPGVNPPVNALNPPVLTSSVQLEKTIDKGYTVQVASYKKEALAQKEAMALRGQGYETLVMNKGSYWILCLGKFSSQNEAKNLMNKLKKRYKDSMIRSF